MTTFILLTYVAGVFVSAALIVLWVRLLYGVAKTVDVPRNGRVAVEGTIIDCRAERIGPISGDACVAWLVGSPYTSLPSELNKGDWAELITLRLDAGSVISIELPTRLLVANGRITKGRATHHTAAPFKRGHPYDGGTNEQEVSVHVGDHVRVTGHFRRAPDDAVDDPMRRSSDDSTPWTIEPPASHYAWIHRGSADDYGWFGVMSRRAYVRLIPSMVMVYASYIAIMHLVGLL